MHSIENLTGRSILFFRNFFFDRYSSQYGHGLTEIAVIFKKPVIAPLIISTELIQNRLPFNGCTWEGRIVAESALQSVMPNLLAEFGSKTIRPGKSSCKLLT